MSGTITSTSQVFITPSHPDSVISWTDIVYVPGILPQIISQSFVWSVVTSPPPVMCQSYIEDRLPVTE